MTVDGQAASDKGQALALCPYRLRPSAFRFPLCSYRLPLTAYRLR